MTLSIGLDAALSGLSATADQTSVVSRNVARAGDPNASRKIANLVTLPGGGVRLASITRATNAALFDKLLGATSDAGAQQAIVDALDQLDQTVNDPELDASPAALVGKLADALQQYAAAPQDATAARSAVAAAGDLARALNAATQTVQQRAHAGGRRHRRRRRPRQHAAGQFETVNSEIVKGTRRGADVTDYLDQRDQILASIAEEVGVRTVTRANNDMAIYTDSGVTLFDVRRANRHASIARCSITPDHDRQCRLCRRRADHGHSSGPMLVGLGAADGPRRGARRASPSPIRASSTRLRAA